MTTPSPEGTALRYNDDKSPLSKLFEFDTALDKLVRVMTQGAIKYDNGNWLKGGQDLQQFLDSGMRHMRKAQNGEVYDPDTGCYHLAHAGWNMLAALRILFHEYPDMNPEFDQASFLLKYTGHEAGPQGYPDDPNPFEVGDYVWDRDTGEPGCVVDVYGPAEVRVDWSNRKIFTTIHSKALTREWPESSDGWQVGDVFWPSDTKTCLPREVLDVNNDGTIDVSMNGNLYPGEPWVFHECYVERGE